MCVISYKEYVLALLLCWNICTSISPTSTHQPKTHATHTHSHTYIYSYIYMCVCARTHVHTQIPDQRTKTGDNDVLYIYDCLTKIL